MKSIVKSSLLSICSYTFLQTKLLKKTTIMFLICTSLLSAQNTNVALGKPTSSDSVYNEFISDNAVDGNSVDHANRWLSSNNAWPHWIEVDLQEDFEIEQLKFWTGHNGSYNSPVQYEFQIWDGAAWITVVDGSSNTQAIIDETFTKVTTSKVRLYGLGGNDAHFRLYEIEVYGIAAGTGNAGDINTSTSLWAFNGNDINYVNGNVGIGTTTPDEKLTVKGSIHSEEVKVDLSVPAPDYVFESNYSLTPLEKLQEYIKINKHLPNIPSAKDMETNGIELGIMNMKLLEKIEELTLYVLEQQKLIENQSSEVKKQAKAIKELQKVNKL